MDCLQSKENLEMPQKQIISKFFEELDMFAMNEAKKNSDLRKNLMACSTKRMKQHCVILKQSAESINRLATLLITKKLSKCQLLLIESNCIARSN